MDDEELRDALKLILDQKIGLEIINKHGGYLKYDPEWKQYIHQTHYRATRDFSEPEDAINSFIDEANES